jgi:hypothetical protein
MATRHARRTDGSALPRHGAGRDSPCQVASIRAIKVAVKLRTRTFAFALCLFAGGLALIAACSNQGEGERCESLNGDDDCKTDEGLVCYPAALLTNTSSDRCCPRDRATATHPVCKTPVEVVGTDGGAPPDTGPPITPAEGGVEDAGDDAATDAEVPADASSDDDGGG